MTATHEKALEAAAAFDCETWPEGGWAKWEELSPAQKKAVKDHMRKTIAIYLRALLAELPDEACVDAEAKAIHEYLHRPDLGGRKYEDDPIKGHHQSMARAAIAADPLRAALKLVSES